MCPYSPIPSPGESVVESVFKTFLSAMDTATGRPFSSCSDSIDQDVTKGQGE